MGILPGTFLRERCRICGEIAEFAPPERWGWRYDSSKGESSLRFSLDLTPACTRCMLEHAPAELKPRLAATIERVLGRKQAIGLPADVTLYLTTSHPAASSPDRWNDIRFTQYVVFYRGQVPEASNVPGLWFPAPEAGTLPFPVDQPFGMLWFGWDTATEDESVVARFSWSAHDWTREGTLNIQGWSRCSAERIARLLHASEDFMRKTRGRPKGITDHSLESYQRAFRTCRERSQRRPMIIECARELDQNRKTVTENLKRWGYLDYRDFAAKMMADP